MEPLDLVRAHTDEYTNLAKSSFVQLAEIWNQLELSSEEQKHEVRHPLTICVHDSMRDQVVFSFEDLIFLIYNWCVAMPFAGRMLSISDDDDPGGMTALHCNFLLQLESILSAASSTWTDAVASAKDQQQQVRNDIRQALAEMMEIKALLGADDPAAEAELARLQNDVLAKASYWQKQKQQRQAEHDELQARIRQLRHVCGLAPVAAPDAPDISTANMRFLELERERLVMERERREDLVRQLLDDLHSVCSDIGEDVKAAAAEAHPSLVYIWDHEAAQVMKDVYKLAGSYIGSSAIDLSDATISMLTSKLAAMKDLRAARSAHAGELLSVLHSLWDAIDVPDSERGHFVKMMSGPLRLHERSLDKDALAAINSEGRNPGAAAELLAKLLHMLAEVQVLTDKRKAIISIITEVEAVQQEETWLASYEADDNRYKGRDANKRLQRAIRATKLRERLPAMLSELRGRLLEWRECEDKPFLYDGKDYQSEVLDGLQAEVEEAAAQRAAKPARSGGGRRQSSIGTAVPPSPTTAGSPSSRPGPYRAGLSSVPRPTSACSFGSPVRRGTAGLAAAGLSSTPVPAALKGVTAKSLTDRHSICVVRTAEREGFTGPGTLSRSGQLNFLAVPRDAARGSGSMRRGVSSSAAVNPLRASTGSFHTPPPKKAPSMAATNVPPRTSVKGLRSTA
eukprot:gene1328-1672_t